MTANEKLAIIDELEELKVPFRRFWDLSDIYFVDTIKTACVRIHNNRIQLLFNEEFWNSFPRKAQLFVVCHEQTHLIFNHIERLRFDEGDVKNKNIAADLVTNHFLVRNYDFEKTDLPNWERYCWVETIFPGSSIPDTETAPYYYTLLKSKGENGGGDGAPLENKEGGDGTDSLPGLVDEHNFDSLPADVKKQLSDILDEFIKEQTENMDEDEKTEWFEKYSQEYHEEYETNYNPNGMGNGKQHHDIKVAPDNNWKSVYKNIPKSILKTKTQSHWLNRSRNHELLPSDLMLPSDFEVDEDSIVRVHVYLDSSGSCISHAKHFLISSLTLPKKFFDVKYFGFGTQVYEIDPKPPYNLKGFGNESYPAVSRHVDSCNKKLDAILVFTDGHSAAPIIKHPKKWHWFITPNGTHKNIPKGCWVYDLAKLHWTGK